MSTAQIDASALPPGDEAIVLPGRVRRAGAGWTWVVQGWRLFARSPVMWIVAVLLLCIIQFALLLVPLLGAIIVHVLNPVFAGGLALACRELEREGSFELEPLFGGFRRHFGALALVGLITLAAEAALVVVVLAFVGFGALATIGAAAASGNLDAAYAALMAASMSMLLATLVGLALAIPLLAAYWFAPALVVLHGLSPMAAFKASFSACLRNFLPFLVNGIVMAIFALIIPITFGLGLFVWLPVAIGMWYASYRDIFTAGELELAPR
jgi:uncharacterized membrane protein